MSMVLMEFYTSKQVYVRCHTIPDNITCIIDQDPCPLIFESVGNLSSILMHKISFEG